MKNKLVASGVLSISDFREITVSDMIDLYKEKQNRDIEAILNQALGNAASQMPKLYRDILKKLND